MLIIPAKGQELTALFGTLADFTTDPIPLGDNDRATLDWNVMDVGSTGVGASMRCFGQVSNDRVNWLFAPGVVLGAAVPGLFRLTAPVHGVFIRFLFRMSVAGAPGDSGRANFDLHVLLDHA
jgi:hypothetical protein